MSEKPLTPLQRSELLKRFEAHLSPYLVAPMRFDVSFDTACGPVALAAVAGRAGFQFREANPVTDGAFLDEWVAAVVLGASALDAVFSFRPDAVVYFPEDMGYYISVAHPDIFSPGGREALRARSSEKARQVIGPQTSREDLRHVSVPYKLSEQEEIFMSASAYWRDDEMSAHWRAALLPFAEAHPGPLYDVIAAYLQHLRQK